MELWKKVILGLILGAFFGAVCPQYVELARPLGDIFLKLIKMIIAPLIFFSLVSGIIGMDNSGVKKIGVKSILMFLLSSCFAVLLGLCMALLIQPGTGAIITFERNSLLTHKFDMSTFLLDIIPKSFVGAMIDGNTFQVLFVAVLTGIAINRVKQNIDSLKQLINTSTSFIFSMVEIIIQLSPYAAFGFVAWVIGTQGMGVLLALSKLVFVAVLAMALQYISFGLWILFFCKISPLPFYKKSLEYQVIAFSTSSTKATLSTTMRVCHDKLGISKTSASFILPIGAAINMTGLAIYLSVATVFLAQISCISLSVTDYIMIAVTSILGSIAGAGVPGGAIMMLPMVLSAINLPIDGIAILVGVDRILDMLRTTLSITGDAAITLIIDYQEGVFDRAKYFTEHK